MLSGLTLSRRSLFPAVLALAVSAAGAEVPSAEYATGASAVAANHQAIAQQWYRLLAGSKPGPAPMVLRLNVPRCYGTTSVSLEYVHGGGMPAEAVAWEYSRRLAPHTANCAKLTVAGTADAGTVGGEFSFAMPDEVSGTTNTLRVEVNGTITGGKVQGTFRAHLMSARTEGVLAGAALTPASAAGIASVRGLPPLDFAGKRPSAMYDTACVLENDSVQVYRQFRALVSVNCDRTAYRDALATNLVPVPVRKSFDAASTNSAAKSANSATASKALKPVTKKEKTLDFDLDAIGGTGLEADPAPKAPVPEAQRSDSPESVRANASAMRAMAANTAWMKSAELAHMAGAPAPAIGRGLTFEDPLFGPWYGTGSLAGPTGGVNRLPAAASAPVQDWPFVGSWQSVGPFGFGPVGWDPVHLPECIPVSGTEFAGKVGPARWKPAPVMPSGCVLLTDLDSYQAAADSEDQQPSGKPARARGKKYVYFAETTIESERDAEVLFAAGCTGYILVWHDGVLAASGPRTETPENIMDETLLFKLNLHRGRNSILVRCESEAYGLFSHGRGTASYLWMRASTGAGQCDPKVSKAWMDEVAGRKKGLPNLPANVRGFRGDQTGFFADADPVTAWDIDKGINVKWITPIERWSKGSPIVVGGKVFACADPNVLVCLDAATGKILWRRAANVLELMDPAEFKKSEQLHQAFLEAKMAADQKLGEIGPDCAARMRALEAKGVLLPQAVADMRAMQGDVERKYGQFLSRLGRALQRLVAGVHVRDSGHRREAGLLQVAHRRDRGL
jgi:hypothetical protein